MCACHGRGSGPVRRCAAAPGPGVAARHLVDARGAVRRRMDRQHLGMPRPSRPAPRTVCSGGVAPPQGSAGAIGGSWDAQSPREPPPPSTGSWPGRVYGRRSLAPVASAAGRDAAAGDGEVSVAMATSPSTAAAATSAAPTAIERGRSSLGSTRGPRATRADAAPRPRQGTWPLVGGGGGGAEGNRGDRRCERGCYAASARGRAGRRRSRRARSDAISHQVGLIISPS